MQTTLYKHEIASKKSQCAKKKMLYEDVFHVPSIKTETSTEVFLRNVIILQLEMESQTPAKQAYEKIKLKALLNLLGVQLSGEKDS